jgi:hypothetical protein
MRRASRLRWLALPLSLSVTVAATAGAQPRRPASAIPDGAGLIRLLGSHAPRAFAPPGAPALGVLVRMPAGMRGADLGLAEAAPGIARLRGSSDAILGFADAHPELPIEVSPPLHLLLDTATVYVGAAAAAAAGMDGTGAVVGIADTGIDVTRPDFLDASGHTRIRWLLDLGSPPRGVHPDLESQFATTDSSGGPVLGAVWTGDEIDAAIQAGTFDNPPSSQAAKVEGLLDGLGHGTLVSACAAGNKTPYRGVAPGADIVFAAIAQPDTGSIANDDLLRGVQFLFDRGDALGEPVVANLSIGSDFGPHDGTTAWEETLASFVGDDKPGHALVVAAGNSGSIVDTPVHDSVHVSPGTTMRVPISTDGAQDGGIEVWVAMHGTTDLSVGLDGPDGTWVDPVGSNDSAGKSTSQYNAGVFNGSVSGSPVPSQSHGAVVAWQGAWPAGTYYVTLTGSGTADLYETPLGDAAGPFGGMPGFTYAVREGTINLPATSPSIIGVGCTINKPSWQTIDPSVPPIFLPVPLLDAVGGTPDPMGRVRDAVSGEPCWFSSGGPTLTGLNKPEIMAPGAAIVGALSTAAIPPAPSSIFTTSSCPLTPSGQPDVTCQQADAHHAVSFGTSFSSPLVAGAIAVLFQHDSTLTQREVVAVLQGGAHALRALGPTPFQDQMGVGELDVPGAVQAADRLRTPVAVDPVRSRSWLAMGADTYLADGTTPLQAILALRAPGASGAPDAPDAPADAFGDGRLLAYALLNGQPYAQWPCVQEPGSGTSAGCQRRGPGVWVITLQPPAGLGGSSLTLGATFDGVDVVDRRSVTIATDAWSGEYPPAAVGGCSAGGGIRAARAASGSAPWWLLAGMLLRRALRPRRPARSRDRRARPHDGWRT